MDLGTDYRKVRPDSSRANPGNPWMLSVSHTRSMSAVNSIKEQFERNQDIVKTTDLGTDYRVRTRTVADENSLPGLHSSTRCNNSVTSWKAEGSAINRPIELHKSASCEKLTSYNNLSPQHGRISDSILDAKRRRSSSDIITQRIIDAKAEGTQMKGWPLTIAEQTEVTGNEFRNLNLQTYEISAENVSHSNYEYDMLPNAHAHKPTGKCYEQSFIQPSSHSSFPKDTMINVKPETDHEYTEGKPHVANTEAKELSNFDNHETLHKNINLENEENNSDEPLYMDMTAHTRRHDSPILPLKYRSAPAAFSPDYENVFFGNTWPKNRGVKKSSFTSHRELIFSPNDNNVTEHAKTKDICDNGDHNSTYVAASTKPISEYSEFQLPSHVGASPCEDLLVLPPHPHVTEKVYQNDLSDDATYLTQEYVQNTSESDESYCKNTQGEESCEELDDTGNFPDEGSQSSRKNSQASSQEVENNSAFGNTRLVGTDVGRVAYIPARFCEHCPHCVRNVADLRRSSVLWCERSEVQDGGILDGMTDKEKHCQEVLYEVIMSENTYNGDLETLIQHVMEDVTIDKVVSCRDKRELFSNIKAIRDVSKCFLMDMKATMDKNSMIDFRICDVIKIYCERDFNAYLSYMGANHLQLQKLEELRRSNQDFSQALLRIEALSDCKRLPLESFLTLPIQRVTRIPLLMKTLLDSMEYTERNCITVKEAYAASKKLAEKCNRSARLWQAIEVVSNIEKTLEFPNGKHINITTKDRSLVKCGSLTRVPQVGGGNPKKNDVCHVFVFNDVVLITKKKRKKYQVVDHADKNDVGVDVMDEDTLLGRLLASASNSRPGRQFLVLTKSGIPSLNYFFTSDSKTDLVRWKESIQEPHLEEDIYKYQSCCRRELRADFSYEAKELDEMSLRQNDLVEVYRELGDGWCDGYNMNSGERGWFPVTQGIRHTDRHTSSQSSN